MKGKKRTGRKGDKAMESRHLTRGKGDKAMKGRVQILVGLLVLSASIIVAGCGTTAAEPTAVPTVVPTVAPTEEPTAVPTETPPQVPDPAAARDAALAYVGQNYDQQVPGPGAGWMDVDITEEGLVGGSSRRYAADRWVVKVTFPVVAPSATIYQVVAANDATGFQWEGEVDAMGQVTELAVAEGPDVLFEGVGFSYDDTIATDVLAEVVPATGPAGPDRAEWEVEPEHIRLSLEGYALPETFHEPRIVVYPIAEMEMVSEMGARIIAAVRQTLADRPVVPQPNPIVPPFNAGQLMSAQLAYLDFVNGSGFRFLTQMGQAYAPINNHELFYAFQGITDDGQWYVAAILPVAHPSLPADGSEIPGDDFGAFADNFETYAAEVAAQLDTEAPGSFTPDLSLLDAMMASLKVAESESSPAAGLPVVAWGGFVKGQPADAQFDDCLALEPEGVGEVGLSGVDNTVEAQIQALRDSGTYAHFWGTLNCPVVDCGGCELVVERLREDRPGPFFDPDAVEAWEGTIVSLPEGAQFDDYFVLAGDFPVGFGIDSVDPGIDAQLASLRDTGTQVRVWGKVEAGVPDTFGTHIVVTRLEVPGEDEGVPSAQQEAACWYGRVESTPADAAIDDYLVLLPEEAKRAVDIVGADAAVEADIQTLRDTGTYAHFWGTLNCRVPAWGGCRLVVTRLRPEGPEGPFFDPDPVAAWSGSVFSTPEDAQFDDYFVKVGGTPMRYGIEGADLAIAAQLAELRDAPAIVRVWGQVTCPAIDYQGSQILVNRLEIVMEAPAEEGLEGWKPYLNEQFGYAVWYPGECRVMGSNLNDAVSFAARDWPVLSVSHFPSEFYNPPGGTDLQQWVIDHVPSYDEIDPGAEIGGLPAVHLRTEASTQADGYDEYYVIKDGHLLRIMILHTGRREDWDLYDKFLGSFSFE